jgi:predicted small lipoprotein YifL
MHIRHFTAATILAAFGTLAGCGADEPGEPNAAQDTADRAPAPESSIPGATDPATGQDLAKGEREAAQSPEPGTQLGTEQATGQDTATDRVAMTEFAALDTDSDGKLAESEWESDVLGGMEFDEIDEDSSGDIDQEEFRQAVAMTEGMSDQQEPSDEETLNPTTP